MKTTPQRYVPVVEDVRLINEALDRQKRGALPFNIVFALGFYWFARFQVQSLILITINGPLVL
jgi:hypothetical protein